jgi:hypothetical protein
MTLSGKQGAPGAPHGRAAAVAIQSTDTALRYILLAFAEGIIDSQAEAFLTDPLQGSGEGLTSRKIQDVRFSCSERPRSCSECTTGRVNVASPSRRIDGSRQVVANCDRRTGKRINDPLAMK